MAEGTRPRWRAPCAGMIEEIRARLPLYGDDWLCGFKDKRVLAATLFIYFANLGPAITFAFYLQDRTAGAIGVVEVLFTMAIGGTLFALVAGQPLVIVGVTGPITVFYETLYQIGVEQLGLPFLPLVACVSLWAALFHLVLAILNALDLVRYMTRFSGEVFGVLIAVLFVESAIKEFVAQFEGAAIEAALLSLLLGLGTFAAASWLASARSWVVARAGVRAFFADYAAVLSIVVLSAAALLPRLYEVNAPRLTTPPTFEPTIPRPWLADLTALPTWAVFASIVPAIILTVLFVFDHNISARLSQEPEFGLVKPPAYNWDIFVLGIVVAITGIFGLPPCNGLIPQAPLHVRALAKIRDAKDPRTADTAAVKAARDAGRREVWLHVVETRVSAFGQSIMLGLTMAPPFLYLLSWIRRGVLAGLFLFMAFSSFKGNELADRTRLLVADRKLVPTTFGAPYARLPFGPTAAFTIIQLVCVAIIFGITLTPAGISFPILIALLVPLRLFVLPRLFSKQTLDVLDPIDPSHAPPPEPSIELEASAPTSEGDISLHTL